MFWQPNNKGIKSDVRRSTFNIQHFFGGTPPKYAISHSLSFAHDKHLNNSFQKTFQLFTLGASLLYKITSLLKAKLASSQS